MVASWARLSASSLVRSEATWVLTVLGARYRTSAICLFVVSRCYQRQYLTLPRTEVIAKRTARDWSVKPMALTAPPHH